MDAMLTIYDNLADNGLQFGYSLHTMHENLTELTNKLDRQRKQWKTTSTQTEKKTREAETAAAKAKAKYHSLADEYDLVKTGDRSAGRHFFRSNNEDDIRQRAEAAQTEYQSRVDVAQRERRELVAIHRPAAVQALRELIAETDAALDLQMQKFGECSRKDQIQPIPPTNTASIATLNEKLALNNGMAMCPPSDGLTPSPPGLASAIAQLNSAEDFGDYVSSFTDKIPMTVQPVEFEQHRVSSGLLDGRNSL